MLIERVYIVSMPSESQTLQAADFFKLGWGLIELRHCAEFLWTASISEMKASFDVSELGPLRSLESDVLRLLAAQSAVIGSGMSDARRRLGEAVARAVSEYRDAWSGQPRRDAIQRFPMPDENEDGESFERHVLMLEDSAFLRAPWDRIDVAALGFESLLPEHHRAAFGLGQLIAVAGLPTFSCSDPLRRPHGSDQVVAWKHSDIVPRALSHVAEINRFYGLDVSVDPAKLEDDPYSESWFDMRDELLTALDPRVLPPYLGVDRNPTARTLRRTDYPPLTLTQLSWNLAVLLLDRREHYVRRAELFTAWNDTEPGAEAFKQALKRLRDKAEEIGIVIQNDHQGGWRFVAAHGSATK